MNNPVSKTQAIIVFGTTQPVIYKLDLVNGFVHKITSNIFIQTKKKKFAQNVTKIVLDVKEIKKINVYPAKLA